MSIEEIVARRAAALATPSDLAPDATRTLSAVLRVLLSDVFALYIKTKNFHWHVSGPHFRDCHLLFDEQADQIFATTDAIAERIRKLGGRAIHSVGEIARLKRLAENEAEFVTAQDMLAELREDNKTSAAQMREIHGICDELGDVATASLLEVWIDEAERRTWFLYEIGRRDEPRS